MTDLSVVPEMAGGSVPFEEKALPVLREDLVLYPRAREKGGAPAWALHDPVRNLFFYISWPAFEILSRWRLGSPNRILDDLEKTSSLDCDADMISEVAGFLQNNQLIDVSSTDHTDYLLSIARKRHVSWLNWLLHHYLFFRVPLLHPDRFLEVNLNAVRWLGSKWFFRASFFALLFSLFMVARQWSVFHATFVDHISLSGAVAFAITLFFAKILHEFGHAFTAKAHGCRVPTMGVAFLVTWPVLYTDVNDSWKLPEQKARLAIGAAGICCELILAIWSTFLWCFLPDGALRTSCFVLATTTWISSLAINLSPFMRFDGYFLLMDILDIPNLHSRSFALARWQIREVLFDLAEPCPEEMSRGKRIGLVLFSFFVWAYRLSVFLGIAFLVYHFVVKIVGLFLFAIEIWWFIIMPVLSELRAWAKLSPRIFKQRRFVFSSLVFVGLVLLASIPWNSRILAPAIQRADKAYDVYVPLAAILTELSVGEGDIVKKGDVLARFSNPVVERRLESAEQRIKTLAYELSASKFHSDYKKRSKSLAQEMKIAEAERDLAQENKERLTLLAPFDGIVSDRTLSHQTGQWVSVSDCLMIIRSQGAGILDAFVAEHDLPRIKLGDMASFLPEGSARRYSVAVEAIAPMAIRNLQVPELASLFGGDIDVRKDRLSLVPDKAFYQVRLRGDNLPGLSSRMRGNLVIYGVPESLLGRVYRSVLVVLLRESGI